MTDTPAPVTVTQEDREAVQVFHREMSARLIADIRDGNNTLEAKGDDSDPIYQAFARHRHQSTAALEEEVGRLKRLLRPFADAADDLDDAHKDSIDIWEAPCALSISAGDLRDARAALAGECGQ